MTATLVVAAALALDALLGEPRRFHPLAGFGRLARAMEARTYRRQDAHPWRQRLGGLVAAASLIVPFAWLATIGRRTSSGPVLDCVLLYLALGWKSLDEHATRVRDALRADDVPKAREGVRMMVSRDTSNMEPGEVCKAAVESVLENGNDAVFGAVFWFVLAGIPGAVGYRLVNTLDAMWGYRNERYHHFGWASARLDDAMNFIPARLTAMSYAAAGSLFLALRCWRDQGKTWPSSNAGAVMAAGAGSLGILLGGPAWYDGARRVRPSLGTGRATEAGDIDRALGLVRRSLLIWLLVLAGGSVFVDDTMAR